MNTSILNIPGLSIAYRTWGNPKNAPIVALHGWLDNANSFLPIAEYLQEEYYLIAVDLPGHGLSSHLPSGVHYHFIDGLFVVKQIIDGLNLGKVHLLGHSLGACIASLAASITPENLLSLSLIEGLGPLTKPADSCPIQLAHFIKTRNIHLIPNKAYPSFESAALARSKKGYVSIDIAKLICERGLVKKNGQFYWRHDKRLLAPSPLQMTEEQVLACLKQIQIKSWLLWGDNGFAYNKELMKNRIQCVKDLTLEYLEGGHHLHMEQPKIVANQLTSFYKSIVA